MSKERKKSVHTRSKSLINIKVTDSGFQRIEKLRKVVSKWELEEPEKKFLNDTCLFRFLKGWDWSVEKAAKALNETVKWRASYKPQLVTLESCGEIAKKGVIYNFGKDLKKRPIVILNVEHLNKNTNWDNMVIFFFFI